MDPERTPQLETPFVARAARWGIVSWALIGVLVLAFFLFRYVVYPVRVIFPPLVVAMIGVYLLNPIVSGMERRGISRVWGTLITYLVALAIVGTALTLAIPVVADQVEAFARSAPGLIERATDAGRDLASRLGFDVQTATEGQDIVDFFGRLLSFTRGLFGLAVVFILGPILAFYLLVDLPKIRRGLRAMIPSSRRAEVEGVLRKIGQAVGGFFRGQLLVALFVGIASSLALWIVGLPFWAVVGLVTGVFNLIPLIGPFIGGIVAVLVAFTTESGGGGLLGLEPGWPLALGSAVALLIVQQLDNHILSPNIVARTVRLHPVTVMLGLLAGGTQLGLWGILLAVPVMAAVKILMLHAWDTKMQWPPPASGEHPVVRPEVERPPSAGPGPVTASATENTPRGPWWNSVLRGVLGPRRRGEPVPPPSVPPEPERTSPRS